MEHTFTKILLQEITKLDILLKAIINEINVNAFSKESLNELNNQAYETSEQLKSRIEDLEEANEDSEFWGEIKSLKDQYLNNVKDLRSANLKAQLTFDIISRTALLQSNSPKEKENDFLVRRCKAKKDEVLSSAVKLTTNLKDITQFVAHAVKQSEDSLNLLTESSSKIQGTNQELRTMDSTVTQSKKLLNKYDRRHVTDKILITIALIFFLTAVLYVVNRRVSLVPLAFRKVYKASKF